MKDFNLVFFGVRGSYPVPNQTVIKYGGNTASLLLESRGQPMILDAGTGIIGIGRYLVNQKPNLKEINICLTHFHIDHIMGIPFFEPVYDPDYKINIFSSETPDARLQETIYSLFNQPLSPIGNEGIKADITFNILDLNSRRTLKIGSHFAVDYVREQHPTTGVLVYRVTCGNKRLVYATDVESPAGFSKETLEFIDGADVLIHDTMYFDWDYFSKDRPKKGYGHSTVSMAVANARKGNVKKLILFHFNPNYSDQQVDDLYKEAKQAFTETYLAEELKNFSI